MSIKAIIYDFDGVIKESTEIKTVAFYKLYEKHGLAIAEKVKAHHLANGGVSRFEKFEYYHRAYLGIELNEAGIQDLAEQFSAIVKEEVISCPYVKGAKENIAQLSKRYDQFIVTGTPQQEIEEIVEQLEINKYFKQLLGSPQNKIDLSQQILDVYGYQSHQVVFIGDATTDHKAAEHHHFHFILRQHPENKSYFENQELLRIKDLSNLVDVIDNIEA